MLITWQSRGGRSQQRGFRRVQMVIGPYIFIEVLHTSTRIELEPPSSIQEGSVPSSFSNRGLIKGCRWQGLPSSMPLANTGPFRPIQLMEKSLSQLFPSSSVLCCCYFTNKLSCNQTSKQFVVNLQSLKVYLSLLNLARYLPHPINCHLNQGTRRDLLAQCEASLMSC